MLFICAAEREEEIGTSTNFYRTIRFGSLSALLVHLTAVLWYHLACYKLTTEHINLEDESICLGGHWIFNAPGSLLPVLKKIFKSSNNKCNTFVMMCVILLEKLLKLTQLWYKHIVNIYF